MLARSGVSPVHLHMGNEAWGIDEVEGSVPKHLISDVEILAHGIAGDGPAHDTSVVQEEPVVPRMFGGGLASGLAAAVNCWLTTQRSRF